jgi:Cobalamin-5-phosphate synthase
MLNLFRAFTQKFLGALVFYTQIPLSHQLPLDFDGIARFAPLIGLFIGILLNAAIGLSDSVTLSSSLVSILIITLWIVITGAIHLDGAMDMADGLGAMERPRRLEIMRDSHTGAYGTVTAILIILIKTTALTALLNSHLSILPSPDLRLVPLGTTDRHRPVPLPPRIRQRQAAQNRRHVFLGRISQRANFAGHRDCWLLPRASHTGTTIDSTDRHRVFWVGI